MPAFIYVFMNSCKLIYCRYSNVNVFEDVPSEYGIQIDNIPIAPLTDESNDMNMDNYQDNYQDNFQDTYDYNTNSSGTNVGEENIDAPMQSLEIDRNDVNADANADANDVSMYEDDVSIDQHFSYLLILII